MSEPVFQLGDRVWRAWRIMDDARRYGRVTDRWQGSASGNQGAPDPPWLYEVTWDDGEKIRNYLDVGLHKCPPIDVQI